MTRVFSAVEVESDEVLDELSRIRDVLNHDFNTVSREKMHITLEFFSDLNEDEITRVTEAMESIDKNSFRITIDGIGCFPSWDYIRVVWAGVKSEELHSLKKEISQHDMESQDREFRPHVTLLRVENIRSDVKKKLKRAMRDYSSHRFGSFEVTRVNLYRSEMTPDGSKYHVISSKELE